MEWNALAVRHNGVTYVLESGMKDSYFIEAEKSDLAVNRVAAGAIYTGGYTHRGEPAASKPAATVTMLDILFLRLNDVPKAGPRDRLATAARSVQLDMPSSAADLTDLYNFQAAMMQVSRSQKMGLDQGLPEALAANIGAYAAACSKCVTRLKKYMDYCPTATSYHRAQDKRAAQEELEEVLQLLTPDAQYRAGVSAANNQISQKKTEKQALELEIADAEKKRYNEAVSPEEEVVAEELLRVLRQKALAAKRAIKQAQEQLRALESDLVAAQTQGVIQLHRLLFSDKISGA